MADYIILVSLPQTLHGYRMRAAVTYVNEGCARHGDPAEGQRNKKDNVLFYSFTTSHYLLKYS